MGLSHLAGAGWLSLRVARWPQAVSNAGTLDRKIFSMRWATRQNFQHNFKIFAGQCASLKLQSDKGEALMLTQSHRHSRLAIPVALATLLWILVVPTSHSSSAQAPLPVPELVVDINSEPSSAMANIRFFPGALPDGRALYSATTTDEGNEVWITDGTIAGTHMVAGFFPGPEGIEPENALLADGVYYFHSRSRDDTLWQTDGDTLSPVTGADGALVPVWDGHQLIGVAGSRSGGLDSVFFLDGDQVTQFPIAPGQVTDSRNPTARASGGMIFWSRSGSSRLIYASDGTSVGTNLLLDPSFAASSVFVVFGNKVAVSVNSGSFLGIFDATTGAPSSANGSADLPVSPSSMIAHGDDGVFYSGSTDMGRELCYYDVETDAHSCFDLNPTGSRLDNSADLLSFEDGVCFAGTDGQAGLEPWCYSLSGGFKPLGDLTPGPAGSDPDDFVAAEDVLYFTVGTGSSAGILHRFDSGSAQAVPYLDLESSTTTDVATPLRVVDDTLVFRGSSASEWDRDTSASNYRPEWESFRAREFLGLSATSGAFNELMVDDTSSTPLHIVPFADGVAMIAFRPSEGYELTAVDSNGDIQREEVCPGTEGIVSGFPNVYRLRSAGDRVFLAHQGQCSSISEELIFWDGALAQQVTLDIASPSSPVIRGMAGEHLIATKNANNPPLYAINATTGVPQVLSETVELPTPFALDYAAPRTTETAQWAIFGSSDDKTYATDGTQLLEVINRPTEFGVVLEEGPEPEDFTVVRFDRSARTVYTLEGPMGTAQPQDGPVLSDIRIQPVGQPVNGFALFVAKDSEGNEGFYVTFGSEYERIADGGGRIAGRGQSGWFYTTTSGGTSIEPTFTNLWFIDEVGNQTLLRTFLDLSARDGRTKGSLVGEAVAARGWLIFSAVTSDGHQLWISQGTPESTRAVPGVFQPTELTVSGDYVYFSAFGPNGEGAELWRIQIPEQIFSDRFQSVAH